MKRVTELFLRIKMFAVELVSLMGFLGILGGVLYWEWRHLVGFLRK